VSKVQGDAPDGRRGSAALAAVRDLTPATPRQLAAAVGLALAYWASAFGSPSLPTASSADIVLWLPAGVALAGLALGGVRLWPGVFVGQLLAGLGLDIGHALILATGASLAAALPAAMLKARRLDLGLGDLPSVLWLMLAGGVLGATLSTASTLLTPGRDWPLDAHDVQALRLGWFGALAAVLVVAPPLMSWRAGAPRRWPAPSVAHLAASVLAVAAAAYLMFLTPGPRGRAWYILPLLIWPALAFSVRGASLAIAAMAAMVFAAALRHVGPFANAGDIAASVALAQQFTCVVAATLLILAAVADERRGSEQLRISAERLREEREALEVLNRTGAAIAAELDLDAAVQAVTDAGVALSGAEFGAFFYNVTDPGGDSYMLYALSGAPRAAFERFGQPRATGVFAPTFAGEGPVRSDDITRDPRYGKNPPHNGMPRGHLPVKSYLAVPVKSRSGEVIGGLFFGHRRAGAFTARAEGLVVGLAAQAAIAIDNARLYQAAQREIAERRRAEAHQRLLMNELNHRVKNTLATVQSMGAQTLRSGRSLAEAREALVSRIMALSAAHNLLTAERWGSADLEDVVRMAVAPFDEPAGTRFEIAGPGLRLPPPSALGLAMALHELGANAARYGALGESGGSVTVTWSRRGDGLVEFVWSEAGGPEVSAPLRRGFGSRLIQEGLSRELRGEVRMDFLPEGLRCVLTFPLESPAPEIDPDLSEEPADSP
jgi:two-component sensor histidine kinase/integral membrane sensor domain MASE1